MTEVEVISRNKEVNTTIVRLIPKTGRTHQLRAHMLSIGHPIAGDRIYGDEETQFTRLMLHARKLAFTLDGENFTFETPLPVAFEA